MDLEKPGFEPGPFGITRMKDSRCILHKRDKPSHLPDEVLQLWSFHEDGQLRPCPMSGKIRFFQLCGSNLEFYCNKNPPR